jgi:membrane protein implicated in regulation of membrane protease activity
MIQRIQSLYLLGSFIVSGILAFVFPLWKDENGLNFYTTSSIPMTILFGLSALLSVISIFLYKKRQHQFVLGRLNIILNVILLGLCLFYSLNLSGETSVSEKGIGLLFPIISIVLLALANKAIKKDEKLVKSVDRLR